MIEPILSIGLPVYNGENYIEEAIASILNQDFADFELIISDNASTDRTPDICRKFADRDPRVHFERQAHNVGAAPNYNYLVRRANGRLFKWAAHDDNLLPGFLRRCVAALDADPNAVLSYPMTMVIDGNGSEIGLFDDGLALPDALPHQRYKRYLRQNFLRQRGLCNPIFGIIRTDLLKRTKLIQDFLASDLILLGHLALLGKFVAIPDVLFERRVHSGISTAKHARHADRRIWFNTAASKASRIKDNEVALRFRHIRSLYSAIDQLVSDPVERRNCRNTLTWLLASDPKWLYIDVKYSLGLRPTWRDSARKIAAGRPTIKKHAGGKN